MALQVILGPVMKAKRRVYVMHIHSRIPFSIPQDINAVRHVCQRK